MKITKKQFLEEVEKEAIALKENATVAEISELNFDMLDPQLPLKCIYGQIADGCRSDRAIELIRKCCQRYVKNPMDNDEAQSKGFRGIRNLINGENNPEPNTYSYLSSIETYILLPDAKNKNLIDFIKGEKEKLVL